ncbi:hypothetical protein [Streptomyces sp. MUM 16J]|uniref:hypothetical protein n=1 Tax=Streptomyces sp. MUM 16J TaxID=2791988 RepID=UPI001F039F9D|nr:hypothetical protein [Streptomyces sp. MUM 16J]MCH0558044.1 hypothetical protein [Streptomyces sp. MUM 16J]
MRRTARALFVACVAGAVLALVGPAASAGPAARVAPHAVRPGGTGTLVVPCDTANGVLPDTPATTSRAFDDGAPHPSRVDGTGTHASVASHTATASPVTTLLVADARAATARAADRPANDPVDRPANDPVDRPANDPAGTRPDAVWSIDGNCSKVPGVPDQAPMTPGTGARGDDGDPCAEPGPCADTPACASVKPCGDGGQCWEEPCEDGTHCHEGDACASSPPCRENEQCHNTGPECTGTGPCSDGADRCAGLRSAPCSDGPGCPEPSPAAHGCAPATVQRGVEAGAGGTFNDSVPALIAGGALIATAFGGAGYRVYGHRRTAGRRTPGL